MDILPLLIYLIKNNIKIGLSWDKRHILAASRMIYAMRCIIAKRGAMPMHTQTAKPHRPLVPRIFMMAYRFIG